MNRKSGHSCVWCSSCVRRSSVLLHQWAPGVMGFKYVFVPADANYPMEELEYKESIDSLENDTFRPFIEKYFASLGQSADRGVLLKQLQERTGVDIKGQVDKGEMAAEAADKLLATTSVEIFPVQLPTKQVDFEGISVYCDDKGIAKDLMVNERMSGIVQAAGYPGQQFRGDCFIGRIYDDTEDEWRRIDFTKQDCSTDAAWVSSTKAQRANRSVGDMQNLAGKLGANNPAHITPSMLEASAPTGETEQYKWTQASDEVEITFKREGIQKEDKKFVKVNFARQKLKVELKGELLIDASLFGATQPDESTWTLSDGVLQVTLSKAEETTWPKLTKD